jgi:CO/xanthine dehydrogenase Mo-binding subunit
MTEMLKKEFSRKTFVKGGGALVVMLTSAGAASAATGNTPFLARGPHDFLPNLSTIDAWVAIRADNTAVVTHGEPEFAGTPTGILQLVAEELGMAMSQMEYAPQESWLNATGGGGGSGGISGRSTRTRAAAAYAKQELLKMASTKLGAPVASLSVKDGVITGGSGSRTVSSSVGRTSTSPSRPSGRTASRRGRASRSSRRTTRSSARCIRGSTSRARSPASTRTSRTCGSRACGTPAG